jgi:hypothetical protein
VFSILFAALGDLSKQFQVRQKVDGSIVMKLVPNGTDRLPDQAERMIHDFAAKYLPDAPFAIEYVGEIPLTAAGKRKIVVVDKPTDAPA